MPYRLFRFPTGPVMLLVVLVLSACALPLDGNVNNMDLTPVYTGAPAIRIASPLPDAVYQQGTPVNILARIENAGADINRVEIKLDDRVIGQSDTPNSSGAAAFSIVNSWFADSAGSHTVSITVSRSNGDSATESVEIEVRATATITPEMTEAVETTELPESDTMDDTDDTENADTTGGDDESVDMADAESDSGDDTDESGDESDSDTEINLPTPVPVEPSATAQPDPTAIPPTLTPATPRVTVLQGANVRGGPGTEFGISGSLAQNTQEDLLAINPAGDWYKITYYNGEAWIFASLVEVSGNTAGLPVDQGPPTPIPVTNTFTPVPATNTPVATNTPATAPNLIPESASTDPHPLVCNVSSAVTVTIANTGNASSGEGGLVLVEAVRVSDNQVIATTETIFTPIAAGDNQTVVAYITVSSYIGEEQIIRVTVDSTNQVAESNEDDNVTFEGSNYVLQPCP